ncbi:proline-rich protein PRCC [Aricia agestis]|uniref:proline-rich protein PRCC n=1 Tax=Aricia agestis TaxID=91739 RepID=UPI001C20A096|nr:proline-rich protein PRCC [Aricia agestis]
MALVAYDNSDSSEYEEDEDGPSAILVTNVKDNKLKQDVNKIIENETTTDNEKESEQDKSLFFQLPQPTSGKITIVEEDDEFLHKKATPSTAPKPKPKITIPSLSDFKDVEDFVSTAKPKTTNGKKSGLLSMLPQPKNGFSSSSTSLIPNSVKQKPQTSAKKKVPLPSPKVAAKPSTLIEYSDESDDEVQNDFFSINKPVEALPDDIPLDVEDKRNSQKDSNTAPRGIESYFKKEEIMNEIPEENYIPFSSEQMETNNVAESSNEVALTEEAILKLCGSRGKRKHEEIQIIDINQQEVLNDAREMLLKGLMDDTSTRQSASKKRGNEPTSQQRRKHQITYLAHQAKANEAELQNQWANNRMTKRKTQSKYGF